LRNLAELNINEGGRPVARRPPLAEDVERFEKRFKVEVPAELRMLLEHANGGHTELDTLLETADHGRHAINRFHHLGHDEAPGGLVYAMVHWRSILGDGALPFASDGAGNPFFVDPGDGSVMICLHPEMQVVRLSGSFSEFIDGLQLDDEMI
jgi:hypothetical protein